MIFSFFPFQLLQHQGCPCRQGAWFLACCEGPGRMLKSRMGCQSQKAGISKVCTRFNSTGTYPPIPFLQPDNPGQLRERAEILVAFSIFKVSSGQTQKCLSMNVIQTLPLFIFETPRLNSRLAQHSRYFCLCLREDKNVRRKRLLGETGFP